MKSTKRINVGIAGLGRFGALHASILSRLPQVDVAAICDPDAGNRANVLEFTNKPAEYDDFESFLAQEDLDCVFIVTPEDLHERMVVTAIDRGLPIFMEKPLALSARQGREIAVKARTANVYLQIGFVLRFETRHAMLQQRVKKGAMGDLVTIRAKRNCSRAWFDVYADRAHSVYETIVHDIDYIVWIVGSPCRSVYAKERNLSGRTYPDASVALLEFENGTLVTLETSWLVPERAPANVLTDSWFGTIDAELEVVGSAQTARLRQLETGLEFWTDDVSQHPDTGLWPSVRGEIVGALEAEDRYFMDRVQSGADGDVASVADAVTGLEIAEAIVESARSGAEVRLNHRT